VWDQTTYSMAKASRPMAMGMKYTRPLTWTFSTTRAIITSATSPENIPHLRCTPTMSTTSSNMASNARNVPRFDRSTV